MTKMKSSTRWANEYLFLRRSTTMILGTEITQRNIEPLQKQGAGNSQGGENEEGNLEGFHHSP